LHKTAFVWDEKYLDYSFPGDHPFKSIRESMAKKLMEERGFFHEIDVVRPTPISEELLLKVHDKEYVDHVKRLSEEGKGYLDSGDTPAFKGIFEASLIRVSGTVKALEVLDKYDHAVNLGGGFHHAKRSSASGFCVFNDVALVAKLAEEKYGRVAIIDLDGHHGDGTQALLYDDPNVLKVSLHMYHRGFFPGTGSAEEIGEGEAKGLTLNVPLPPGTGDDAYLEAFREVVVKKIRQFKPRLFVVVEGGDSHFGDPLVELKLSTRGYLEAIKKIHGLAHEYADGKLILLGVGGYNYDATARIWTLSVAEIAGIEEGEVETLHDCCFTSSTPFVKNKVEEVIKELKKIHGLGDKD
jgi:acetoin utilization protein AcuC